MTISKIWSRWIFTDLLKFIIFFLICLYFVFFTVDISIHGSKILSRSSASLIDFVFYYYHHFIIYLNLFLCIALMFAIIKVLYSLNSGRELIALHMSGISKRKLSLPIFAIALPIVVLSYINFEYLTPISTKCIEDFKNNNYRLKKKDPKNLVNTIFLSSGSKIVYQKYDSENNELFDVFFIKSQSEIWHIKSLDTHSLPPKGKFVDYFVRDSLDKLVKKESFDSYIFEDMDFDKTASRSLQPYESRPISALFAQYRFNRFSSSVEKAHTLSQLNYKLSMPLLPLIIVMALVPPCTRFSRHSIQYLLFFLSLIFFIGFYVLMDAAVLLSENRAGSPFGIIWTPVIICFILSSIKFFKGR